MDLYTFDSEIQKQENVTIICGTDEAGRGPLAGPVTAAAVILDPSNPIERLNDSKKLSEKKREKLFDEITEKAVAYSVVHIDNNTIDEINILQASLKAMAQAVENLNTAPQLVLVDGNFIPKTKQKAIPIIKGDSKSACIAAASILAKVTRDRLMKVYAEQYPEFEFARHKGYPTKLHYEKIEMYGATKIHRRSFLKKVKNLKEYSQKEEQTEL